MNISPDGLDSPSTADHDGTVLPIATHAANAQHDVFLSRWHFELDPQFSGVLDLSPEAPEQILSESNGSDPKNLKINDE